MIVETYVCDVCGKPMVQQGTRYHCAAARRERDLPFAARTHGYTGSYPAISMQVREWAKANPPSTFDPNDILDG